MRLSPRAVIPCSPLRSGGSAPPLAGSATILDMSKRRRNEGAGDTHVGEYGSYGFVIVSRPMALLANKYTRFAKITRVIRYRKEQPAEDVVYVPGEIEHWGEDDRAAIAKAITEVRGWIDRQPKQPDDLR